MDWLERKLSELEPITEEQQKIISEAFDAAMDLMVNTCRGQVPEDVIQAMEEGCMEARILTDSIKTKESESSGEN